MKTVLGKKIFLPLSFTVLLVEMYFKKARQEVVKLNAELSSRLKDKTLQVDKAKESLYAEINERKLAEKKLKQTNEQLRKLTAHQQLVREDERTRIAREIHDVLGQQLTVLKMDLSWLHKKLDKKQTELSHKTQLMLHVVDETVQLVKKISTELRPGILDDLGLMAAIEWQCHEFSQRLGVKCQFNTSLNELHLERDVSTGIFRIFQEAFTNIARHSAASVITIDVSWDKDLVMEIQDNGKGITEQEINNIKSLGLLSMKERAHIMGGELSINGTIGKGTIIKLIIPVPQR